MLTDVIQVILSALSTGSTYALLSLGVTLIYNSTNIINFAQGEFLMLGGMTMVSLYGEMRWPLYLCIPATVAVVIIVGMALMKVSYRPGKSTSLITVLIITIGASLFISGTARHIWDADVHRFPPFSGETPIRFLGAAVVPQSLWIIGLTACTLFILGIFFRNTIYGKAMKACSLDRAAAEMLGIRATRTVLCSFIMSAGFGCLGGIIMTPVTMITSDSGMLLAIKGMSAAMLGGMGSFPGAVIGAFIFAFLESFASILVSSSLKDLVTFIVIINVLLFMPRGIMGHRKVEGLGQEEVLGD